MALFEDLWSIQRREYSARDLDIECHGRIAPIMLAFVEWHNVEVFKLLWEMRHKHYLCVPDRCVSLDPPQALLIVRPLFSFIVLASSKGVCLILTSSG